MTAPIASGFIAEAHSATAAVLQKGKQLNDAGGLKALLAHTAIPVSAFVTAALDTVAHAFGTLVDGSLLILKSPVWLATVGNIDMAPGATFSTVSQHAVRTAGNLTMTVAVPLTSLFSCDAALAILDRTKIAPGASQDQSQISVWTSIAAQKDLKTKAVYAWDHKSEVAKAILTLTKQVGNGGLDLADQYKKHAAYTAGGAAVLFSAHQAWYGLVQKEEVMLGRFVNSTLALVGLRNTSEQQPPVIEQPLIKPVNTPNSDDNQNSINQSPSMSPTSSPTPSISKATTSNTVTSSPTPSTSKTVTSSTTISNSDTKTATKTPTATATKTTSPSSSTKDADQPSGDPWSWAEIDSRILDGKGEEYMNQAWSWLGYGKKE